MTDPDANDYMFQRGMGEFSVFTDLAFERHLERLREMNKPEFTY
jgi:hypothetical protein